MREDKQPPRADRGAHQADAAIYATEKQLKEQAPAAPMASARR